MPKAIDLLFQVNLEFMSFHYFHQKPHFIALLLEVKLEESVFSVLSSKTKGSSLTLPSTFVSFCFFIILMKSHRL